MKCTACGATLHGHAAVEKLKNELATANARIMELERELATASSRPAITAAEAMQLSGVTAPDVLVLELDEVIHELNSEGASDVNNQGLDRQLEYIVALVGSDRARDILRTLGK